MSDRVIRIGVDIGGTFTDVALAHPGGLSTTKVLTDYDRPETAILEGVLAASRAAGVTPADIAEVIHGTTLVTNALIQRRGARLAFVTTEGFRDVIEMRSENRFEQYDLNLVLPEPLVPRKDRFTLPERVSADGDVLQNLDPEAVERLVAKIVEANYEAVAVGLIHSYANDRHERMVADAFMRMAPNLLVSLSSVVSPQMRELPRFNTVIANAYVRPLVSDYLGRLERRFRNESITAPVFMMHSGGGLMSVETAAAQPVRLLESGPAGGAIFAAGFARAQKIDKALSFDMGGTTAKICLIEDGTPKTAQSFEIARTYRFKKGSGMTVSTPVVEMVEIGAGGGSIASVDNLGRLRVGPKSAGSEPGPAAYGQGGEKPTVTDANLALGRLDAARFAGGAIPLDEVAAKLAIESELAGPLGVDATEAAFGVSELVDENMANAARVHAIENGRDIEAFTMIAFGGGAPLHTCRLCEKLGVTRAIVPPGAGVGSAIGFLGAPFSFEATRGLFQRLDAFDIDAVNAMLGELQAEAKGFLEQGRHRHGTPKQRLLASMRYAGQGWEIPVEIDPECFSRGDVQRLHAAFETAYARLFGRIIDGLAVEVTNWALTLATPVDPPTEIELAEPRQEVAVEGWRAMFDAGLREVVEAKLVPREAMKAGRFVDGPAAIVEDETTTIVTAAFRAIGQSDGSLLLQRKEATG